MEIAPVPHRPSRVALALPVSKAHIPGMATSANTVTVKKPIVLGRSALTGRVVMAPVVTKKSSVSDKRIIAAVKSVLAKKK